MSQGLCPSCGAAVNLTAGQTETKCQYCENIVLPQQAEAQFTLFSEIKKNKFGGVLILAEMAQEVGKHSTALKYYNKIVEQQIDFSEVWLNRGICLVCALDTDWLNSEDADAPIIRKVNSSWAEAISSWKAAVKFAKDPGAMGKRLTLTINSVLTEL